MAKINLTNLNQSRNDKYFDDIRIGNFFLSLSNNLYLKTDLDKAILLSSGLSHSFKREAPVSIITELSITFKSPKF